MGVPLPGRVRGNAERGCFVELFSDSRRTLAARVGGRRRGPSRPTRKVVASRRHEAVVRLLQTEACHAASERARGHSEDLGGATGTGDRPVRLFQNFGDVLALHVVE